MAEIPKELLDKLDAECGTDEGRPVSNRLLAEEKAKALMQRGRAATLKIAIEEAIASLESGMALGALVTLREALRDDKEFYS